MANKNSAVYLNADGLLKAFGKLESGLAYHLGRSMLVAGGKVISDEAKARAPVYVPGQGRNGRPQGVNARSAATRGSLKQSIYLAYEDGLSGDINGQYASNGLLSYKISWNAKRVRGKGYAPHGHLVELGHWLVNHDGTPHLNKFGKPQWVPAYPFLRPALEAKKGDALEAMLKRGRERLPELIKEAQKESK